MGLFRIAERKKLLGSPVHKWQANIKMYLNSLMLRTLFNCLWMQSLTGFVKIAINIHIPNKQEVYWTPE
jgi:hypothetical protein